jgi:hypothetical protein
VPFDAIHNATPMLSAVPRPRLSRESLMMLRS